MNLGLRQLRKGATLQSAAPPTKSDAFWGRMTQRLAEQGPFRAVMCDPAWPFGDKLPGAGRGAEKHYRLTAMEELYTFPLPPLHDDCVLFLWRVSSMPQEALDVVKAWGFKPKTEIVWRKLTKMGNRHFGMGRITRAEHETCIVATRGRPQVKVKNIRSVFDAEIPKFLEHAIDENGEDIYLEENGYWTNGLFEARVGQHSAKPEAIYEIIESLFPGPYLSVFDRRQRRGWRCIGDEVAAGVPYADR